MPIQSLPDLLSALQQAQLLDPGQLQEVRRSFAKPNADSRLLAKHLIQKGWLTPFQINQVYQGQGKSLVLGSYLLLERLGEGGMGEVYKARHREMNRIVAVKLIHKKHLNDPHAIGRFHREVQAVAQLNHPNIVRALDANHVGDVQFLVMEYVAGIDLSKRVKSQGPLAINAACDYIRQAALALQHAHEHGLIHRDVKPSNLLLTPEPAPNYPLGTVTLLDLGLARIVHLNQEAMDNTLTDSAHVIGTPDFLAPEQARHAKHIDHRADLYSLGCTCYFLLTGRVPFPAETFTEKLIQHTLEEPIPVQRHRPEIPAGVCRLVQTLMAKKPEDRIQTAGEVARIIAGGLSDSTWAASGPSTWLQRVFSRGSDSQRPGSETISYHPNAMPTPEGKAHHSPRPAIRSRSRSRFFMLSAAGVFGIALLGWLLLALFRAGDARSATNAKGVVVSPVSSRAGTAIGTATGTVSGTVAGTDPAWLAMVRKLPAEEQFKAVDRRIRELNPRFQGPIDHRTENGIVTELELVADDVADLTPLQALTSLKVLHCSGTYERKSKLSDLSFIKGMQLTELHFASTQVPSLAPFVGMSLRECDCSDTPVSDLSPLRGMPMRTVNCNGTRVADLQPLQGMKLVNLWCNGTPIHDLSPLQGMPLVRLSCRSTKVSDLSVLRGMPLKFLVCDYRAERDATILSSIKTLETINDKPAREFFR